MSSRQSLNHTLDFKLVGTNLAIDFVRDIVMLLEHFACLQDVFVSGFSNACRAEVLLKIFVLVESVVMTKVKLSCSIALFQL